MSLQSKFLLYFLAFASLPLLLAGTIVFSIIRSDLKQEAIEYLSTVADLSSKRLNEALSHSVEQVKLVASRTQLRASVEEYEKTHDQKERRKSTEQMKKILLDVKNSVGSISELSIYDSSGVVVSTSPERTGALPEDTYQKALKSFYTDRLFKDESGVLRLRLFGPLISRDGKSIGVLQIIASADAVTTITKDYTGLKETGEITLAEKDSAGNAVFLAPLRFDPDAAFTRTVAKTDTNKPITHAVSGEERVFSEKEMTDYRGVPTIAVTRFIPAAGWGMTAQMSAEEATSGINAIRDIYLFIIIFTLLVVVFLSMIVSQSIVSPVWELVRVSGKFKTADFSEQAVISNKDEIGELGVSFNEMAAALKESYSGLEEKVKERTKELEAFSYSVSHDLRSPLRAIDGFSKILVEEYEPALPAEAQRIISVIQTNTRNMGELIDDLLDFSRFGRQEVKTQEVDMTQMAKSVYGELKAAVPDRNIEFILKDLPPARVDPALFRHVWINYLANAIKFTRKTEKAKIEVGAREGGEKNEVAYYVKDNGVGFNMQYANKLFGVFQRLHTTEEFEGSGVGLAIVNRIIVKHGGRTWGEGAVDQGAEFYFALPKKEN